MSKLHYVGPRVEISHHGINYKKSKEDKYIYLTSALEILKDIDNDYEKKPSYTHQFDNKKLLDEEILHSTLQAHEYDLQESIDNECRIYKDKIDHKIQYIRSIPSLSDIDKEVWIKNIELMKEYNIQRALNKMYYFHCIHDIAHLIRNKKIKVITAPFNKNFFHVLNTLKGTLITGKPSLDARVKKEYDQSNNLVVKLTIK